MRLPLSYRMRAALLGLTGALLVAAAGVWLVPYLMHRYDHHGLRHVTVATGLETPWAIAFLPDQRMLVTERLGRIRIVQRDGRVGPPLAGVPPVFARFEGGLMDVALDPNFSANQRIYWSYSEPSAANDGRAGTAVARGRLGAEGLTDVTVIFREPVKENDGRHYGSRLLFAPDGRLFVSLGDRAARGDAQKLGSTHGKILRLESDGSAPADNPFASTPGAPAHGLVAGPPQRARPGVSTWHRRALGQRTWAAGR